MQYMSLSSVPALSHVRVNTDRLHCQCCSGLCSTLAPENILLMHPASGSPPGKRSPNRQLLTTLRIPTHLATSRQDDSPRRMSTVIWRTCLIIAGLAVLNAALAAVILTAVRGFSGYDTACAPINSNCKHFSDMMQAASSCKPWWSNMLRWLQSSSQPSEASAGAYQLMFRQDLFRQDIKWHRFLAAMCAVTHMATMSCCRLISLTPGLAAQSA